MATQRIWKPVFYKNGCSFDNRSSDDVVNYWTDFSKFYQALTSWERVEFHSLDKLLSDLNGDSVATISFYMMLE